MKIPVTLLAVAALGASAGLAPAADASSKLCAKDDNGAQNIRATHVSCTTAKKVAKRYLKDKSPYGYSCKATGVDQNHIKCQKHGKTVTWTYGIG
jgi:hypothetical protein